MKKIIFNQNRFLILLFAFSGLGFSSLSLASIISQSITSSPIVPQSAVPEEPDFVCSGGRCTEKMGSILSDYKNLGSEISLEPAVYSGECFHKMDNYDSDRTDYAVVMLDQHPDGKRSYFSTIFAFMYDENEFANWNLEESRKQMSPYWLDHGDIVKVNSSATSYVMVPYDNGDPAYIYYFRQNPATEEIYYITVAGVYQTSFCRLKKN